MEGLTAAPRRIVIDYKPRRWARPFHASYLRWYALILHRRAGKTTAIINHHQRAATSDAWETRRLRALKPELTDAQIAPLLRYRLYAHILPTYRQAKLTAWEIAKYYASFVPGAVPNESELRIDYPCRRGHVRRLQLFGADNPDALRGAALSGLSLDEYGQHPPNIFGEVLSKALADHLGYAVFAGTIKGKNQLYRTWDAGRADQGTWFALWQDVSESLATEDDAATVMLQQAMQDDRALIAKGLMTQEEYDQEWFLSTTAAIKGAYYARAMVMARKDGRVARVPFDPALPVDTDWDLGMDDTTAIVFSQSLRSREVRLIDYYANSGEGLEFYARILKEKGQERGYVYGQHWAPHDIEVRELGTGKTRKAVAKSLGIDFQVTPNIGLADGIDAVRLLLPRVWMDEERCGPLIEALTHYRKTWNERLQEFTATPWHDWASHPADAVRGLAVRHRVPELEKTRARADRQQVGGNQAWMA